MTSPKAELFPILWCCVCMWKLGGWAEEAVLSSVPDYTTTRGLSKVLKWLFYYSLALAEVWKSGSEVCCSALPITVLIIELQERARAWRGFCGLPEQCCLGTANVQALCGGWLQRNSISKRNRAVWKNLLKDCSKLSIKGEIGSDEKEGYSDEKVGNGGWSQQVHQEGLGQAHGDGQHCFCGIFPLGLGAVLFTVDYVFLLDSITLSPCDKVIFFFLSRNISTATI